MSFGGGGRPRGQNPNPREAHMNAITLPTASASAPASAAPGTRARRAGWVLTALVGTFMVFDAAMKLTTSPEAVEATAQLGWSPAQMPTIATIALVCTVLYLVPRTA